MYSNAIWKVKITYWQKHRSWLVLQMFLQGLVHSWLVWYNWQAGDLLIQRGYPGEWHQKLLKEKAGGSEVEAFDLYLGLRDRRVSVDCHLIHPAGKLSVPPQKKTLARRGVTVNPCTSILQKTCSGQPHKNREFSSPLPGQTLKVAKTCNALQRFCGRHRMKTIYIPPTHTTIYCNWTPLTIDEDYLDHGDYEERQWLHKHLD